ncbi:hypothetical protein PanWU01x14_225510 [Parasponia andersonii]|uniref:Uncharacterized protein n=1 Tax=Parasponia andersonii TaxID=3476 RepID=A0A2P5BMT3_PARAD|nr:hypothetical protein PanWU01x14_225510 [Parasponia andersonii]
MRVFGKQSWSRDESNGGGGTVIGRRTAARRVKNRSGGEIFRPRFLRRQAAVHGSSTRCWFVDVSRSRRIGASGMAADGGGSDEQFSWAASGGPPWRRRRNGGAFMQFFKTVAVGHVAQSDSAEKISF